MRNNNRLCYLAFLLLLQLATRSGAQEMKAHQTLIEKQQSKRAGMELTAAELAATHVRRRLKEEGGAKDEAEDANDEGEADSLKENEKKDEESKNEEEDKKSASNDEAEGATKEEEDKKSASKDEAKEATKEEEDKKSASKDETKEATKEEEEKKGASKDETKEATKEEEDKKSASKDEEDDKKSASKDEAEGAKSASKDEDGDKKSASKDEDGDKKSASEDEEEGAKDGKASESKDEDETGGKEDEASSDESNDGDAKDAEKPAPAMDDISKAYFDTTKDAVLDKPGDDGDNSSGEGPSDEDPSDSWDSPPSFYDMKDYSFETISMTSCQKIDFAVAYLTSLEFDGSIVSSSKKKQKESNSSSKKKQKESKFWSDIWIAEMVVLPTSLILAFFGSSLLLSASMLAAAGFGTFLVFHFVSSAFGGLDCKVKLGLSAVSAGVCAALAVKFVRFGLFTLGAVSSGLAAYLFFDSFPAFDPGQNFFDAQGLVSDASYLSSVMKHSDISQAAWAITSVIAVFTGICIRVYEQASVEFLTALLGGTGVGYAVHAHILVHGGSLKRSFVFVISFLVSTLGLRFQRRRRLRSLATKGKGSLPQFQANTPSNGATWNQLQKSIDTTNAMLQSQGDDKAAAELAGLLNNFQSSVKERGKDN